MVWCKFYCLPREWISFMFKKISSGTSGKEPAWECRRYKMLFQSLGQEDPLEKGMQPTPIFLPGEFHRQRSLAGYSPWGHRESDTTEWLTLFLFQEDHSSHWVDGFYFWFFVCFVLFCFHSINIFGWDTTKLE